MAGGKQTLVVGRKGSRGGGFRPESRCYTPGMFPRIEERRVAAMRAGLLIGMLLLAPSIALAHAILVRSYPAKHQVIDGKDVAFDFHFNARVDGARSTLTLVTPDGKRSALALAAQPSRDSLAAHATGLAAGEYTVHWQVLSSDGHITSGDVPFTVRPGKE